MPNEPAAKECESDIMISFVLTLKRLLSGLFHVFHHKRFRVLFVVTLFMLLSGTIFYTREEGLPILDALYFCIATLSTSGHPTFVPQTPFGKILRCCISSSALNLFMGLMSYIAYGVVKSSQREDEEEREQRNGGTKSTVRRKRQDGSDAEADS